MMDWLQRLTIPFWLQKKLEAEKKSRKKGSRK